jgi:hypothetical protein
MVMSYDRFEYDETRLMTIVQRVLGAGTAV